jgi:hypothetical protein
VPKKKKTSQAESGSGPSEAGGSAAEMKIKRKPAVRRAPATRKNAVARKKGATKKVATPAEIAQREEPSDEEVRLRAYFISERRRRFALPGDAESDWLEAKRQLLSEARR